MTSPAPILSRDLPHVSVVIPVHNGERFLRQAIESVLEQTCRPLEIIVVDDGSTDASRTIAESVPLVRYIHQDHRGVAAARNAGIEAARGELLAFLDQDDVWLTDKLRLQVDALMGNRRLGFVLSRHRFAREPGVPVPGWCRPEWFGKSMPGWLPSALVVRSWVFDEVGTFDTAYTASSDADWFFRARDLGIPHEILPLELHLRRVHETNQSRDVATTKAELRRIARASILRRSSAGAAAENGFGGVRLLMIDARISTPDRDGGSLRAYNLLTILSGLGVDLTFVPSFPASFAPFESTLQQDSDRLESIGVRLPTRGTTITVEEHMRAHGAEYDVVWLSGVHVASRHLGCVLAHAPLARVVFDTIDLHFLREYRGARVTGNVHRIQNALRVKRAELDVARRADCTLVVSDREQSLLERELPGVRTAVVPNVHSVPGTDSAFHARRDLLFLGAFTFEPNVDAMSFFVGDVWPAVREAVPGARLMIVGSDPGDIVTSLAGEDVVVTGYVANLAEYFDCARVFIAPLRYGAGIKGKLLLSMSHGLPAVASPVAIEGIPVSDGHDVLVAQSPDEWVDRIRRVYNDEVLWRELSGNAQNLVCRHYSFRSARQRLKELLRSLRAAGARDRRQA